MLGWERFTALRHAEPKEFRRLLRQPQHFLSPDRRRFAPVRLLRELGSGLNFPVVRKDPVAFSVLRPQLVASGWTVVEDGHPEFETLYEAWRAYCQDFGQENVPRNWRGNDPHSGRTFTIPSGTP